MLIPSGPATAKLMIVSECVTYRDIQSNTILNDREFDRMLSAAGANRTECFITAFIRGQISGQNFDLQVAQSKKAITPDHVPLHNKYVKRGVLQHVEALERDIDLVRPKIVLVLGNGALFALTGKWGVKSWRSSILDYTSPEGHSCKIIPTYHPSFVQSVWKERNTVIFDMKKAWELARQEAPVEEPKYNFIIEPSFPAVANCLNELLKKAEAGPIRISEDIETRGGHIACIGLAWSEVDAICIPLMRAQHAEITEAVHYWRAEEEAFLMHLLYKLTTHPNCQIIGQNFLYDAQYFLRHLHYVPNFKRDTMIARHSTFSNLPKGLDVLSSFHCKYHKYWKDESKNWDPKLGERQLWIYNCIDCVRTFEIDEDQQNTLSIFEPTWPQIRAVHDFQQSLFWPVLQTMDRGLRVNNASKEKLSAELEAAIATRNNWITELLGQPLNIKSPVQMKDWFYNVFQQKPILSRQTHSLTCDDSALERIATREPLLLPLCTVIRELRSLGVFRSTFLEAPVDTDERMRCSFNITGTETYRFSSSENAFGSGMNLQNIPSGDEESGLPNIRNLFVCDEGMEFFDIDLDSADLRIVTWDSDCTKMKQWFAEGKKPYVEVAKEYFQDDSITKDHDAYKAFKVICHATNYLGKGPTILDRMPKSAKLGNSLTADAITKIQAWYFDLFPEIKEWQDRTVREVSQRGYIENVFGYREHIFDRIEGTIFNQAVAWKPQSTVACLINRGYRNIYNRHPDIQVLLQVHDSLAGQYPIADRDSARKKIIDCCSVPLPYASGDLTIPVGIKTSTISWGDCK
jgi:DNA polymerase I-like protein with 3'-5' exonuclease and polymerase domains/uracil-DNA glycosylase